MSDKSEPPVLLVLPSFIQTREQVYALMSEILQIEDFLYKAQVRESGTKMSLPKTTPDLDKFASANKRNILNHNHRVELAKFLRGVYKLAPAVSVTVALDPHSSLIDGIIEWFRSHVHAQTLVQVNQQASVGPGCIVRIKHKTYDMSLKRSFDNATHVLSEALAVPAHKTATIERRSFV